MSTDNTDSDLFALCVSRLQQGEHIETILADLPPARATEVTPLVTLVHALAALPIEAKPTTLRAPARATLKGRLAAQLAAMPPAPGHPHVIYDMANELPVIAGEPDLPVLIPFRSRPRRAVGRNVLMAIAALVACILGAAGIGGGIGTPPLAPPPVPVVTPTPNGPTSPMTATQTMPDETHAAEETLTPWPAVPTVTAVPRATASPTTGSTTSVPPTQTHPQSQPSSGAALPTTRASVATPYAVHAPPTATHSLAPVTKTEDRSPTPTITAPPPAPPARATATHPPTTRRSDDTPEPTTPGDDHGGGSGKGKGGSPTKTPKP